MRMHFGKYYGYEISEIPFSYLRWLYENVELQPDLEEAVLHAMEAAAPPRRGEGPKALMTSELRKVYRQLALKYHPDHGGSDMAMRAVNEFYESLKG